MVLVLDYGELKLGLNSLQKVLAPSSEEDMKDGGQTGLMLVYLPGISCVRRQM